MEGQIRWGLKAGRIHTLAPDPAQGPSTSSWPEMAGDSPQGTPCDPATYLLAGIAHTVVAATAQLGWCSTDGGKGHGLLGQEGGRGLKQGWRVSEGRAQAPLLAQDLLVGHGVDGVGESEGWAARQSGGRGVCVVSLRPKRHCSRCGPGHTTTRASLTQEPAVRAGRGGARL